MAALDACLPVLVLTLEMWKDHQAAEGRGEQAERHSCDPQPILLQQGNAPSCVPLGEGVMLSRVSKGRLGRKAPMCVCHWAFCCVAASDQYMHLISPLFVLLQNLVLVSF